MTGKCAYLVQCCQPLASVRKWGEVVWNVFRYLLSETLIFFVIAIGSLSLIHLASRISTLAFHSPMGNAGEIMGLALYVGVFTILFLAPLKAALIPKSVQDFEGLHPLLFGGLRMAFLILVFPIGLFLQFGTFYFRYSTQAPVPEEEEALVSGKTIRIGRRNSSTGTGAAGEPPDTPQLYYNDVLFLLSLVVMIVYPSARVLTAYREFERKKLQFEFGFPERAPQINYHYVKYCFGLTGMEAMVAILLFIFSLGLGVFLQLVFFREWATYLALCISGAILGQGLGFLEMEYFGMDEQFRMTEPLFPLMHWDARRVFLFLIGMPLLSEIYFDNDFYQDFGPRGVFYHFILFAALMATNVALLARYQTVFSHRVAQQARVYPSPGSRSSGECGGGGGEGREMLQEPGRSHGVSSNIKSFLAGHFPMDLDGHLRGLQGLDDVTPEGGVVTQLDQSGGGSISTGTCTSLLNRANNNASSTTMDTEARMRMARIEEGSLGKLKGSSSVVVQRLETTIQLEDQVELELVRKPDNLVLVKGCKDNDMDYNANVFDQMVEAQISQEDLDKADLEFCIISETDIRSPAPQEGILNLNDDKDKEPHHHHDVILEEEEFEELELGLPPRPPSQPLIKLKRCPSNLPCCDVVLELDSEDEGGKL